MDFEKQFLLSLLSIKDFEEVTLELISLIRKRNTLNHPGNHLFEMYFSSNGGTGSTARAALSRQGAIFIALPE